MNLSPRFFTALTVISVLALITAIVFQIVDPDSPIKIVAGLIGVVGLVLPRTLIKQARRDGTWHYPNKSAESESEDD